MKGTEQQLEQLRQENDALRIRLEEAHNTISAIQNGEVDAMVVNSPEGAQVFSLKGVDHSYRILIEEMHEGAVTLAVDGTVLYANKYIEKMLEPPLEKIVGFEMAQYVQPDDIGTFKDALTQGSSGCFSTELKFITGNGGTLPVLLSASRVTFDDVPAFCLAVTDLTDQKKTQDALEKANLDGLVKSPFA